MKPNPIFNDVEADADDPMSLLTNLFDVAMVFAVALMMAFVAHFNMNEIFTQENFTIVKNPGADNMEIVVKEGDKIKKYTPSDDESSDARSRGRRVGTAYQLDNGEIVYIPE